MYSGQFEKLSSVIFVLAWVAVFACGVPLSVPFTPPQAARRVPALEKVSPAAPSRRSPCRRDSRPSTSCSKKRSSSRSRSGIYGLLLGDEDRVDWVPGEQHLATRTERIRSLSRAVLLDGGELLPAGCVDDVLDRGAEEARDLDAAAQVVDPLGRAHLGGQQRDLLGADADAQR